MALMEYDKEKNRINEIARKYSLKLLLLFGSRASKEHYESSDFDVAYLSERILDLEEELRMVMELYPFFKSENVDIVNLKNAPPLLMKLIFEKHEVLFCSDLRAYNLYKIYAVKRYIEAAPIFRLRDELINKYFSKI